MTEGLGRRLIALNGMTNSYLFGYKRFYQEFWPNINRSKVHSIEPCKPQRPMTFCSKVWTLRQGQGRHWIRGGSKVQADFMMGLASMEEEVLGYAEELPTLDLNPQLFGELSDDGFGCRFTQLDSATRKCPEIIALKLMEEDVVASQDDRGCAEVELVCPGIEGDHCALTLNGRKQKVSRSRHM